MIQQAARGTLGGRIYAAAVQVGANTVINITANDTITLNGITKTSLVANDFSFF